MLVRDDQGQSAEVNGGRQDSDQVREVDLSPLDPLCDEDEFDELLGEMVADLAPRLFAVVQVYRERVDGRIAAWGMAFEDRAEIVGVDDRTRMSLCSPERALVGFDRRPDVRARIVWLDPDSAVV